MRITSIGAAKWSSFLAIKDTALACNGVIFGGAVRDIVLHNSAAAKFYQHTISLNTQLDDPNITKHYDDASFHPETADRLIIPHDVDVCFYSSDDYSSFKKKLIDEYDFVVCYESDASSGDEQGLSYGNVMPTGWTHIKLLLRLHMPRSIRSYIVDAPLFYIDVLLPDESCSSKVLNAQKMRLPPFNMPDFECNGMVLLKVRSNEIITIDDVMLSYGSGCWGMERQEKLAQIIQDTLDKRAVYVNSDPLPHRLSKMHNKGFAVCSHCIKVLPVPETRRATESADISTATTTKQKNHIATHENTTEVTETIDNAVGTTAGEEDASAGPSSQNQQDVCLICHDPLDDQTSSSTLLTARKVFVQMQCCYAKYHAACLKTVLSRCRDCPQCRQTLIHRSPDIALLKMLSCGDSVTAETPASPY